MKKIISCFGMLSIMGVCLTGSVPEEEPPKEIEVIETKVYFQTYPSPVDLIKEEVHYTTNWDEKGNDNTIQISQEDAQMLMKIAFSEGGNQGVQGQLMIMQTVWNRVLSDQFPDSIKEVIEQPSQFSSVTDGRYQKAEPTAETHQALAEFEKILSHDENLIGFETIDNGESLLSYFDFYTTYKDHNFYTTKKD